MAFDIVSFTLGIVISVIITAPVLWLAGRLLVGSSKAKFTDAIMIVILGGIARAVISAVVGGYIGALAQIVVLLFLIKHYYECDWSKALVVAVLTVVIFVVILIILGFLGLSLLSSVLG